MSEDFKPYVAEPLPEAIPLPPISAEPAPKPALPSMPLSESIAEWTLSIQSLMVTVVIAVFVITFVIQAFQIPSESMENTLLIGDYLLVDKLRYGADGPWSYVVPYQPVERGDIVVFHYPVNPAQHFVKRVIGLPGDRIRLVNKQVFINGEPLKENYTRFSSPVRNLYRDDFPQVDRIDPGEDSRWYTRMKEVVRRGELTVPKGEYFVLGDNRDESLDSRYWGLVPRENILGRPLLIYWSLRGLDGERAATSTFGDKLFHLAYVVTHLFQITRWDRTFRLVR
jgi:signal peptidase I